MSVILCCHILQIWACLWKYKHLSLKWPYLELSEFKQLYLPNPVRYFIQIFRFSRLINCCEVIEDWKPKLQWFQNLHFPVLLRSCVNRVLEIRLKCLVFDQITPLKTWALLLCTSSGSFVCIVLYAIGFQLNPCIIDDCSKNSSLLTERLGLRNLPPPCCVLEQGTLLPESTG